MGILLDIVSLILLGKKTGLLFLGLLILIHFCFLSKNKYNYRKVYLSIIVLFLLFNILFLDKIVGFPAFWKSIYQDKGLFLR